MLKSLTAFLVDIVDSWSTRTVTAIETCTATPHLATVTVKTEYFMGYKPATYAEHVVPCYLYNKTRILLSWDDPLGWSAEQLYNSNAEAAFNL